MGLYASKVWAKMEEPPVLLKRFRDYTAEEQAARNKKAKQRGKKRKLGGGGGH